MYPTYIYAERLFSCKLLAICSRQVLAICEPNPSFVQALLHYMFERAKCLPLRWIGNVNDDGLGARSKWYYRVYMQIFQMGLV